MTGMRAPNPKTTPRWPFWLLLVAWVCANSPQAATYAVLSWMADARKFSHQQQLTREVAYLLAGEKAPEQRTTAVAAVKQQETKPLRSAVPAAAVLKKIDLSTEQRPHNLRLSMGVPTLASADHARAGTLRAPPPHEPPRTAILAT